MKEAIVIVGKAAEESGDIEGYNHKQTCEMMDRYIKMQVVLSIVEQQKRYYETKLIGIKYASPQNSIWHDIATNVETVHLKIRAGTVVRQWPRFSEDFRIDCELTVYSNDGHETVTGTSNSTSGDVTTFHPFHIDSYDFLLSAFPPRVYSAHANNAYEFRDSSTYNLICLRLMYQPPTDEWHTQHRREEEGVIYCEWHRDITKEDPAPTAQSESHENPQIV